jgi:hypothetical protein
MWEWKAYEWNVMGMFGLVGLAYTNEVEDGLFMLN